MEKSLAARVKQWVVTGLKIAVSAAILAWVIYDVDQKNPGALFDLLHPRHWWYLGAALLSCGTAILITLIRWHWLVRALEIPSTLRESVRIGFVGYLFNLAPMGIVGGDLLKGWMLARNRVGLRTKAFASVIVDRVIGLYMLFVVGSVAILATDFLAVPVVEIRWACQLMIAVTVVSTLGLVPLFWPGLTESRIAHRLESLPRVGPMLEKVIESMRMYRRRWDVLAVSCLMSVAVHSFFSLGLYLIGRGLFLDYHTLPSLLVMSPVSATMGMVPLPMGPMEAVLEFFYLQSPAPLGATIVAGQGLSVALAYRVITLIVALVGMGYYLASRREVARVMEEVEREEQSPGESPVDQPPTRLLASRSARG